MRLKSFKKSTLASPNLRKRKRRRLIVKLVVVLLALALVIAGLAELSRFGAVTIRTVETEGTSLADPQLVEQTAETALRGNYLWIFSKSNFLLYPKKTIKADVEKQFPVFDSVNVFLKDFHTLDIKVTERRAAALWCVYDGTLPDPFTDTCYFMDATGYIYLPAPEFKGSAYIHYYGAVTGDPIGQTFLPGKLKTLGDLATGVDELGLAPASLYVHGDDYDLNLASGGKLLLNSDNDVEGTLENLGTILRTIAAQSPNGGTSDIDYIDLRYGNKVYFKLKPEAQ